MDWTQRKQIFRTYFVPFWETEKNVRYRNLMKIVYIDHLAHNLGNEIRDSQIKYQELSDKLSDINDDVRVVKNSISENKANIEANKEKLKTLQDNENNCQCKDTPVETETEYEFNWSDFDLEPDPTPDLKYTLDFNEGSGITPTAG